MRRIEKLERDVRLLGGARSAQATEVGSGGMRSSDFDGMDADTPGTRGWAIGRTLGGESYVIINGKLYVGGAAFVTGVLTVLGTLAINGATTITGPLSIEGSTTITGDTNVTGALDVSGDLGVGGDFDLAGSGVVTGALQSSNYAAGTAGWRLTPTTVEINDAAFKAQVVPDAALAHIIKGDAKNTSADGALAAGMNNVASVTFTVPSGVTTAAVNATSSLWLTSSDTQPEMYTVINGNVGPEMWVALDTGAASMNASSSHARVFSVTPGATFTVLTRVTLTALSSARVSTSATAIFYR